MFRPRSEEKEKIATVKIVTMNREVNVPLVKTTDGKEYYPKHKSSRSGSVVSGASPEDEQAVQAQESKRRKRRILKIAVYCMFGIIALGVFAIWLFHKNSVESLRFGSRFLFTIKLRSLEIRDHHTEGVLYGDMGKRLMATPYDHCWDDEYKNYKPDCRRWKNSAELTVEQYMPRNDSDLGVCYTFSWVALYDDFTAEDCFYLQHYRWYGILTNYTPAWPIESVHLSDMTNYYEEYPHEQKDNLVPIWYSSRGVSIFVDSSFPFSLGWNTTDKRQFCITSKISPDIAQNHSEVIRYTVCQAPDMKQVYRVGQQYRGEKDIEFPEIPEVDQLKQLITPKPILTLRNDSDVQNLIGQFKKNETQCSLFEIYDEWESSFGDLTMNEKNSSFKHLQQLTEIAGTTQCYPILPISTFFSYTSEHFRKGIDQGYFVRDRQNLVTRMVHWRGHEGAVLDVTNERAKKWFVHHIEKLKTKFNARALKLLHLSIPSDSSYNNQDLTYLDYNRIFYRDLAELNTTLVLEHTTGFIPYPVYLPIRMTFFHNEEANDFCLNTSVAYSLTMSLSGYSLLIADADPLASESTTVEMFKRWLQVAMFFPVLEIPSIPLLHNKDMRAFLNKILTQRSTDILPYLNETWFQEPDLPILRPLVWEWPEDFFAQTNDDHFMVGDALLVAPVLCSGKTTRIVYLPPGQWRAGWKSSFTLSGPHEYSMDVSDYNVVPYFWRLDQNGDQWRRPEI